MKLLLTSAGISNRSIAERWASRIPVPTYAIEDATAITVVDGTVEVVSEGDWELFAAKR